MLQVDADRAHVADGLLGRFFEGKNDGAFAAAAGAVDKGGAQAALAGARRAGYQHAAAAVIALAAQHGVQVLDAGGYPLGRNVLGQADRSDRHHRDAVLINQKRVFVGAVRGTAVFDYPQAAQADLITEPAVEHDDAVAHILLQPLPRQRLGSAFAGDDGGHSLLLEPAKEATDFGAQDRGIGQGGKKRFDGIERHAFGADRVDGMPQPDEDPFQVEFTCLRDLAALEMDVVQDQLLAPDQARQIKSDRGHIVGQFLGVLFERHKDTRLVEVRGAAHQKLHGQQCLATARAATDQRRPPGRQSPVGDRI